MSWETSLVIPPSLPSWTECSHMGHKCSLTQRSTLTTLASLDSTAQGTVLLPKSERPCSVAISVGGCEEREKNLFLD